MRVEIKPELLAWAIDRSGVDRVALQQRFTNLDAWLTQTVKPTIKQAEDFAKATYTPFGFLFLDKPPNEELPIPDFRTLADQKINRPSANLLDTIYSCQQRQYWFREYLLNHGEKECRFVGSKSITHSIVECAKEISVSVGFNVEQRASIATWEEALNAFIDGIELARVLVMRSGTVGNNTHRKLSVAEFRGFVLVDTVAPLIFLNGADSKSAQMFTLAHELAHIWLGQTALSNADVNKNEFHSIERWCNQVAAEILIPRHNLQEQLKSNESVESSIKRLAKVYKVSTLVVLRSLFDAEQFSRIEFNSLYENELNRVAELNKRNAGGGDFYRNQRRKLSPTFARALIGSAVQGETSYRDAMRMLGIRKPSTFEELGRKLEVLL